MMNARSLGGLCGFAVILLSVCHGIGLGQAPPAIPATAAPADQPKPPNPRGAGSCSVTACHGSIQPLAGRVLRDEHTTWITRDEHANAYMTLINERSCAIMSNLPGEYKPAYREERCLACHATPVPKAVAARAETLKEEGVGCESCHGPAERWIGKHTCEGWAKTLEDKERAGMFPLGNLVRRAKICAGCHVGEPARGDHPARDVNHDLIAAGHPRLDFEFSAYLANMAHHWQPGIEPDANADFAARAWVIGQIVSAQAALDLLRDRAAGARNAVWHEFSEYGCFSCHHDLRDEPWRREQQDVTRQLGTPFWGSWHYPMLEVLASIERNDKGKTFLTELQTLRDLMTSALPDRVAVVRQASVASRALEGWLDVIARRNFDADLVRQIQSELESRTATTWDEAAQRYLGLAALARALQSLPEGHADPKRLESLQKLLDFLQHPDGAGGPRDFKPSSAPRVP